MAELCNFPVTGYGDEVVGDKHCSFNKTPTNSIQAASKRYNLQEVNCWAQSLKNERAWAVVPTRVQCGTSHTPFNRFADFLQIFLRNFP